MKADLTRNTFHPYKHFTQVLMQQGRVQIDADWNEQAAILTRYLRALAADIIGPHGGPAENLGFAITNFDIPTKVGLDYFVIGAGHYYVDGILCENEPTSVPVTSADGDLKVIAEVWTVDGISFSKGQLLEAFDAATPPNRTFTRVLTAVESTRTLTLDPNFRGIQHNAMLRVRRALTFDSQPDYPLPTGMTLNPGTTYQVYLDVWERLITYVEDDSIREVALGGVDTCARARMICQVKCMPLPAFTEQCGTPQSLENTFQPTNRGLLKARTVPTVAATDPCIISPNSSYRGPENQLYRVEIHTGKLSQDDGSITGDTTTFKWSRENGAVVFPIISGGGTSTVTLETLGRDDRFGLAVGDYVEVQDDNSVLLNFNHADNLLTVQSIDAAKMQVKLNGTLNANVGSDPTKHPILRRWDQKPGDDNDGGLTLGPDSAAEIIEGAGETGWLNLEDGIQIQFQPSGSIKPIPYRRGDYWLIPARTATGNVDWPTEMGVDGQNNPIVVPAALPPLGVKHHYAPLAIFTPPDVLQFCQNKFTYK